MPSGSSYRPGDIVRMYNGKTVEVLNTDAEGRMILADALAYGISKYSPKCVIDFATLTGACIIALGTNVAGIIGNNDKLIQQLRVSGTTTGEKIWQLPLYEEFFDLQKDPREQINLMERLVYHAPKWLKQLREEINDNLRAEPKGVIRAEMPEDEKKAIEERLKRLGYVTE